MPRTARIAPGGIIYHALNRGCGRCTLFDKVGDYDAFERVLDYALQCDPHLYQGRFKSFPIEQDDHLLTGIRYVERNALRADLVQRAEQWRWCSLWRRIYGSEQSKAILHPCPLEMPHDWVERVNLPHTQGELAALRHSAARGTPFGSEPWQLQTAQRLGLARTLRPRGRPPREG